MLLEFTVGNYRSFKDKQTIIFGPTGVSKDVSDMGACPNISLIYGPNSAGKSNLVRALDYSSKVINGLSSGFDNEVYRGNYNRMSNNPTFFEYVLALNNHIFRYGFEIEGKTISREWLYDVNETGAIELFDVNHRTLKTSNSSESLIISKNNNSSDHIGINQRYGHELNWIRGWFREKFLVKLGDTPYDIIPMELTANILEDLVKLLAEHKIYLANISLVEKEYSGINQVPYDGVRNEVVFYHNKGKSYLCYRTKNKTENLEFRHDGFGGRNFINQESSGTMRLAYLLLIYLNHKAMCETIKKRRTACTVVIDEIECSLDTPSLLHILNKYWKNPIEGVQLISTTHESKLLSDGNCNPREIWFTERRREGPDCTRVYSLRDFEDIPSVIDVAYRRGMFGAVPITRMPKFGDE